MMAGQKEGAVCGDCAGARTRLVLHKRTGEHHPMPCACTAELPIAFVYQPEAAGCGMAALAMATGKSYAEVRAYLGMAKDLTKRGLGADETNALLDRLGFAVRERFLYDPRFNAKRAVWPCAPWADVHICQVQNLSDTGAHAVVMLRDGRVLDPWWGVIDGLHRYPEVFRITAVHQVEPPNVENSDAALTGGA